MGGREGGDGVGRSWLPECFQASNCSRLNQQVLSAVSDGACTLAAKQLLRSLLWQALSNNSPMATESSAESMLLNDRLCWTTPAVGQPLLLDIHSCWLCCVFCVCEQEAQKQAGERETALLGEKGLLKTAVTAAIAQKESLEAQLAALQKEHTALLNERSNLRNQVSDLGGRVGADSSSLRNQVSDLRGGVGAEKSSS